ncbi:hypothetical protein ACPOL_6436 [Acidisarcina polymorpha]|uniref:Uncharacterized protein n=1 Tax=Acidisarcina polymorpha TaxID=2211140 RepID=A0A2Z5GAN7_9BACT|nr:hypothetical protein ACPOL_6436 [Acidisarcina polymorpha]
MSHEIPRAHGHPFCEFANGEVVVEIVRNPKQKITNRPSS